MSDASNPFKSLADSLLSGNAPESSTQPLGSDTPNAEPTLGQRIDAFFTAELLQTRLDELASIGRVDDLNADDFIWAVAEEDPDLLLRIAAMVQLFRRKVSEDLEPLLALFDEEVENPRVYSLGLMLIEELPEHLLEHVVSHLIETIPDEATNCAALIQLIREAKPSELTVVLEQTTGNLQGDFEALDEEVWDELLLCLEVEEPRLANLKAQVQTYIAGLAENHPRRLEFS